MNDRVFTLLLLIGLGIAITQVLVGYQLLIINQEFRVANAQRGMAIEQNVQILENQGRILEALLRWAEPAEKKVAK